MYSIDHGELIVWIVRVAHRREVYRRRRDLSEEKRMKLVPVTEAKAKAKLTALVHDAENEDIALLRHGKPAAD